MNKYQINSLFVQDSCSINQSSFCSDNQFQIPPEVDNNRQPEESNQFTNSHKPQAEIPSKKQASNNDTTVRQTNCKQKVKNSNNINLHGTLISTGVVNNSKKIQRHSNETKNLPSQFGRVIINHLKSKGHQGLPDSKKIKNLNSFNRLIMNNSYREDVLNYFTSNQILSDLLDSPRLQTNTMLAILDRFELYYRAFLNSQPIENQN